MSEKLRLDGCGVSAVQEDYQGNMAYVRTEPLSRQPQTYVNVNGNLVEKLSVRYIASKNSEDDCLGEKHDILEH